MLAVLLCAVCAPPGALAASGKQTAAAEPQARRSAALQSGERPAVAFAKQTRRCEPVWDEEPTDGDTQLPEEWSRIVEDAPMTAEEFGAMTLPDWLAWLGEQLQGSIKRPLRLFAKLCGVLLLASVGQSLCADRTSPELLGLLDTVAALAIFALCAAPVTALAGLLEDAIQASRTYIVSFVPVFASVLTACGQAGSAALYSGVFFSIAMVIADVLCRVGLPFSRLLLAMTAASAASGTQTLFRLTEAVCKWTKWLMTLCATVFGGLIGLQGIFAQSADTLAMKTGKFIFSSSVPVVGRAISDAMGSVLAGMRLVKGTVGFAAIAAIAAAFLPLLVQCCLYRLLFAAGELAAEAFGGGKGAKLLSGLGDCVGIYLSMIVFFSLIVISATLMMILFGNL